MGALDVANPRANLIYASDCTSIPELQNWVRQCRAPQEQLNDKVVEQRPLCSGKFAGTIPKGAVNVESASAVIKAIQQAGNTTKYGVLGVTKYRERLNIGQYATLWELLDKCQADLFTYLRRNL